MSSSNSSWEILHSSLDLAGLAPAVGIAPDLLNCILYCIRGKWGFAGLSLASAVPALGQSVTAGKLGAKAVKAARTAPTRVLIRQTTHRLARETDRLADLVESSVSKKQVAKVYKDLRRKMGKEVDLRYGTRADEYLASGDAGGGIIGGEYVPKGSKTDFEKPGFPITYNRPTIWLRRTAQGERVPASRRLINLLHEYYHHKQGRMFGTDHFWNIGIDGLEIPAYTWTNIQLRRLLRGLSPRDTMKGF